MQLFLLKIRCTDVTTVCKKSKPERYVNDYINIDTVHQSFGYEMCSILPQFHAITSFDTTSYRLRRGKLQTSQKLMENQNNLQLLSDLRKSY